MVVMMKINSVSDLFNELDISESLLGDNLRADLDRDGFLVLPPDNDYLKRCGTSLDEMGKVLDALYEEEGDRGGWEGLEFVYEREPGKPADPGAHRLGNLINKHSCFRSLIAMPEVLLAAHHILKNEFRISAVDMREPQKGGGQQRIHVDWEPRMKESDPFDCMFCYFAIDDMHLKNGPLRVVPKTQTTLDYPDEYIDTKSEHPDEIYVEIEAGARFIVNSLIWHSGTENESGDRRRVTFTEYRRRDLPQLLNQQIYLSDEVKQELNEAQRWLLSVGPDFPVDKTRHYGPGDAYRRRYSTASAHEMTV